MQTIVVYGLRFKQGNWTDWEHTCSIEEINGVLDSAKAKAFDYGRQGRPAYVDFLEGSKYMFNVAYGPRDNPAEGDTMVYGVRVDNMVLGDWRALKSHFENPGAPSEFFISRRD